MDFKERLHRATERGHRVRDAQAQAEAAKALDEEECRRLHSAWRLELCDHIETCLKQLADNFPGFRLAPVVDEGGWGSAISRDDLSIHRGRRENHFSRLTMTVSPHNEFHVLEVSAKGTIRNRESFSRKHFQFLKDADLDSFHQLIEQWALDYAEQYAASGG